MPSHLYACGNILVHFLIYLSNGIAILNNFDNPSWKGLGRCCYLLAYKIGHLRYAGLFIGQAHRVWAIIHRCFDRLFYTKITAICFCHIAVCIFHTFFSFHTAAYPIVFIAIGLPLFKLLQRRIAFLAYGQAGARCFGC